MYIVYLLTFLLLLIISAFFSASETAFFSLSSTELERLRGKTDFQSRQIVQLMTYPKKLLITIIIGNTVVNITAASLATILTLDICQILNLDLQIGILINVAVVTFVILIFSEIVPKIGAVKNAKQLARRFAFPLTIVYYLFLPMVSIFHTLTQWLTTIFRIHKNKLHLSDQELRSLLDFVEEKGTLQKEEKDMIHSIFEFGETTVWEIMVPRIDMVCVPADIEFNLLLDLIRKNLHSRIPVYKEKVDNIVGILFVKDLLVYLDQPASTGINLEKLARPAYFVPRQKKIDELLREFQNQRIHMAIVVDEYGGTSGLVTLEDIIEEIFGEIQDEHDLELPLYQRLNESEIIIDGSMDLSEIKDRLKIDLPAEEGVSTLAGFLYGQFGSVPQEKQTVLFDGYEFVIEKVIRRRIKQVRVIIKANIGKSV
jgi:putative hemolysin